MFEIYVDQEPFKNIISVEYTSTMEKLCRSYVIEFYDEDYFLGKKKFGNDSVVEIYLGGELIGTCYIDEFYKEERSGSRAMGIQGRSKPCDIVDSDVEMYQFRGVKFTSLVEKMIEPYGISLVDKTNNSDSIKEASFTLGQKILPALSQYAKKSKVYMTDGENGEIVIDKYSDDIVGVYGMSHFENVKYTKVFSVLKSKNRVFVNGRNSKVGEHVNSDIRYRYESKQIDLVQEQHVLDMLARYEYELQKSASEKLEIPPFLGFRSQDGNIWAINKNIRLKLDEFGMDEVYRITGVKMTQSFNEAVTTSLTIKRKDVFDIQEQGDMG